MTVKESQKISDKAKTMKFGFFFDGSELLNEIDRKRNYIFYWPPIPNRKATRSK